MLTHSLLSKPGELLPVLEPPPVKLVVKISKNCESRALRNHNQHLEPKPSHAKPPTTETERTGEDTGCRTSLPVAEDTEDVKTKSTPGLNRDP
jgi:hypothetical protein